MQLTLLLPSCRYLALPSNYQLLFQGRPLLPLDQVARALPEGVLQLQGSGESDAPRASRVAAQLPVAFVHKEVGVLKFSVHINVIATVDYVRTLVVREGLRLLAARGSSDSVAVGGAVSALGAEQGGDGRSGAEELRVFAVPRRGWSPVQTEASQQQQTERTRRNPVTSFAADMKAILP